MTEQERDQILLSLQENMLSLKDDVSGLKVDVSGLKVDVSGLKDDVLDLKKGHRSLSRSIAVLEVEHSRKIDLLVDGQILILEKLDSFEKRFESNEEDLEDHSNRIWNLEKNVGII